VKIADSTKMILKLNPAGRAIRDAEP